MQILKKQLEKRERKKSELLGVNRSFDDLPSLFKAAQEKYPGIELAFEDVSQKA